MLDELAHHRVQGHAGRHADARFFIDLNDAAVKTAVALVHSRYSTNTTPSWERAHPNRYIVHNGEINTLRGNVNWIRARDPTCTAPCCSTILSA